MRTTVPGRDPGSTVAGGRTNDDKGARCSGMNPPSRGKATPGAGRKKPASIKAAIPMLLVACVATAACSSPEETTRQDRTLTEAREGAEKVASRAEALLMLGKAKTPQEALKRGNEALSPVTSDGMSVTGRSEGTSALVTATLEGTSTSIPVCYDPATGRFLAGKDPVTQDDLACPGGERP